MGDHVIDRETLLANIREVRNMKLEQSDVEYLKVLETSTSWTDYNSNRAAWVTYRNALRDYPSTIPDPYEDDLSDIPPIPLSPTEQAAVDAQEAAEAEE